jgi:DNA-binding MarR family transcriptional regulator
MVVNSNYMYDATICMQIACIQGEEVEMPKTEGATQAQDELVEQILRFTKSIHRVKLALTKEVPDRAAYGLLYPLVESDKRAAELADIVHSDPSTISRHISQLVASELVQRVPDQKDGRATLLSLTEKGRGLCNSLREHRATALARAVDNWSDSDTETLARLLTRLNDDMDVRHNEILDGFRSVYDAAEAGSTTSNKENA